MSKLNSAIIQRRDHFVGPSAMLFGPEWQHAIARSLGPLHPDGSREAIDSRLVRRWASGERVVPIWVISALARMLESGATEVDSMRTRLRCAEAAIAVELQEFSVEQVTNHDIRIKHGPSADVFRFDHDGRLIAGRYTHVPGPRTDPDDPEIELRAESARHAARDRLSMTPRPRSGPMTNIHRVHLTKKKLAAMPQAERSLLLLLGHASNEINVLSKLILMARKDEPDIKLIDHVEAGQVFIIMRVLIGKLHEAWRLFQKRFQGNRPLAEKYVPIFPPEAAAALTKLNKHFGTKSPLTAIRNAVSFHYTDDQNLTEANFQRLPETEPWEFYLSRTVGNSFYYASELVVAGGVISLAIDNPQSGDAPAADLNLDARAFAALCDTVTEASGHITELFGQIIALMVMTSIGEDVETTIVEVPDGPKISSFHLPFFFDENDALPVTSR